MVLLDHPYHPSIPFVLILIPSKFVSTLNKIGRCDRLQGCVFETQQILKGESVDHPGQSTEGILSRNSRTKHEQEVLSRQFQHQIRQNLPLIGTSGPFSRLPWWITKGTLTTEEVEFKVKPIASTLKVLRSLQGKETNVDIIIDRKMINFTCGKTKFSFARN